MSDFVRFHEIRHARDSLIKEIVSIVNQQLRAYGEWVEVDQRDLDKIDEYDQELLDIYNNYSKGRRDGR
jgi:hypothetical protein